MSKEWAFSFLNKACWLIDIKATEPMMIVAAMIVKTVTGSPAMRWPSKTATTGMIDEIDGSWTHQGSILLRSFPFFKLSLSFLVNSSSTFSVSG